MGEKLKLETLVADAGKAAKTLFDNAVNIVDRNDDGKFDFTDVAAIAEAVGDAAKEGAQVVKDSAAERAREREKNALQPIFADTLDAVDFSMSRFVRVADRDKKYTESEVCRGSIGYLSYPRKLRIVNIFRDSIDAFGLTFYPKRDYELYCVDPSDRNCYIALDEYFSYLKIARINELKKIAQDLGAKHFKVTYMEERASLSKKIVNANIKAATIASAAVDHCSSEKKYERIELAAENEFPGHAPIKPKLKYLREDPSIQTLVSMRMDEQSPLIHEKYLLSLSSSSGLKVSDAVTIDAVLKGLKYEGNTTVESEARNESRRYFEYDIAF